MKYDLSADPRVLKETGRLADLKARKANQQAELQEARKGPASKDDEALALISGTEPARESHDATELRKQIAVTERAIELQTTAVEEARSAVSGEIAKAAKPEYAKIIRRLAKALTELKAVSDAERGFREALDNAGVSFAHVIKPCGLPAVMRPGDDDFATGWLAEAAANYGVSG